MVFFVLLNLFFEDLNFTNLSVSVKFVDIKYLEKSST